jgi:hypothetical protein
MELVDQLSNTILLEDERQAIIEFCSEAISNLESSLISINLYGKCVTGQFKSGKNIINLLVVVNQIDRSVLNKVLNPVRKARDKHIDVFLLTELDLLSSTDVYPGIFRGMKEMYKLLWGKDCLAILEIKQEYLRLQCERMLKNLLLWLQRYYLVSGGQRLTEMMLQKIEGFLESLHLLAFLKQNQAYTINTMIENSNILFNIDPELLLKVRSLGNSKTKLSKEEAEQLYFDFMSSVGKAAQIADRL